MNSKIIAISEEGEVTHHARANCASDYVTLCSMDGDDITIGIRTVHATMKTIDCCICKSTWEEAKRFTHKDFEK